MKNRTCYLAFALFAAGLLVTQDAFGQTLQYAPYGAWRGRAVARDGLFHVQRYHWGNGITPVGGSVLNTAIPVLAEVGLAALGRGEDASRDAASRGPAAWAGWPEYKKSQDEANALLQRTAALLNSGVPGPNVVPAPAGTPAEINGSKLTPEQYKAEFGANPWDAVGGQ